MKKIIGKLIVFVGIMTGLSSCEKFLDQTPDAVAFSEEQIFSDYEKSQKYIDQLLVPYTYMDDNDLWGDQSYQGFFGKSGVGSRERITDNCIASSSTWAIQNSFRYGAGSGENDAYWSEGSSSRYGACWKAIRVANTAILNINRITNATQEQKDKILGMAYFMRAHFYFILLQGWGGMPMITNLIDPAQNMDLPRDSYTVTAQKIAATFDSATVYLPMVVAITDWNRPSKMAAVAYKAKALIWAASPFSNPQGNQELWADAAIATGKAIDMAEKSGYYRLVPLTNFKRLFADVNEESLHEVIFGRLFLNQYCNGAPYSCGIKSADFGNAWTGAESVTENLAQSFGWNNGQPVDPTTAEYKSKPFTGDGTTHTGRDPRFYETILFNGAITPQVAAKSRTVEIWNEAYNSIAAKELQVNAQFISNGGHTATGYYNWKLFTAAFVTKGRTNLMSNFIRLADLYLYYAEAANRAWGPTVAPSTIPGFTMTATESLNKIRTRANMPVYDNSKPWLTIGSVNEFEAKIRNESRIETAFEDKRFYDLRRWRLMTDPNITIMKGLYIKRTAANVFQYNVVLLPDNQNLKWQEQHYLFKIKQNDTYLGPNFKQNPGW